MFESWNIRARLSEDEIALHETIQQCFTIGRSLLNEATNEGPLEPLHTFIAALGGKSKSIHVGVLDDLTTLPGYLNLFRLGFVHRDISPGNIIILDGKNSDPLLDAPYGHKNVDIIQTSQT